METYCTANNGINHGGVTNRVCHGTTANRLCHGTVGEDTDKYGETKLPKKSGKWLLTLVTNSG
jgi:hypothetical protein